ncbi:shikimate kinase AroL [Brenneria roseae subsp. roseae]|uniref:shikimate kinase AroL n=1 Tax=Brenneria roseae TaxID=1509241 RepID=UPI000D616FEF|nr:shikimate kinase AroL [Brenneria roseae]PWC16982.1 shikimate kinase AroL [Brenneria roseae subsp. roseae]
MINTIILVGPRASGKTTVGKILAAHLKLDFIDTDEVVQKKTNKTIAQIVDEQGWDNFRMIEGQILKEVTLAGCIIATGGGMVISQENRNHMKNRGIVFYLSTSAETVVSRLKSNPAVSQRPSLTGLSITEEITGIIKMRDPLYQETAHFVIDANNEKERVAQEIDAIYHALLKDAANDAMAIPPLTE